MAEPGRNRAASIEDIQSILKEADELFLSTSEIAEAADVSRPTAIKYLEELKEQGAVRRRDFAGGAVWYLPELENRRLVEWSSEDANVQLVGWGPDESGEAAPSDSKTAEHSSDEADDTQHARPDGGVSRGGGIVADSLRLPIRSEEEVDAVNSVAEYLGLAGFSAVLAILLATVRVFAPAGFPNLINVGGGVVFVFFAALALGFGKAALLHLGWYAPDIEGYTETDPELV